MTITKRAHVVSGVAALLTLFLAVSCHDYISCVLASLFYGLLVWNAVIDYYTRTLFVWVSHAALGIALVFHMWNHWADVVWWTHTAVMFLCMGVPLWLASSLSHGRLLGIGDVRLFIAVIVWHGVDGLTVFVLAIVAAGLISLVGLAMCRMNFSSVIPFGPFITAASWAIWVSTSSFSLAQSVI